MVIHLPPNAGGQSRYGRLLLAMLAVTLVCDFGRADQPNWDDSVPPSPGSAVKSPGGRKPASAAEKLWQDRPLTSLNASIKHPEGDLPTNLAGPILAGYGVLFDSIDDDRPWIVANEVEWDAPATRNLPLFFEEPNLERLGYTYRLYVDPLGYESGPEIGEIVQPFVSGVHFFGRIPFTPYISGVEPPLEPIYTLGVDRPGSPVANREQLIPISLRGAIYQVGAVCALVFSIP